MHQPARGFRYSADAFWLAGFALEPGIPATALDLGTGSGVVAFLLAARGIDVRGIDRYPGWELGWEASLRDSTVAPVLQLCDVREVAGPAEIVTCNPPYFPRGSGPVSSDPFRAAARTEASATLSDFVERAVQLATERAVFIIPTSRMEEVLHRARPFSLVRRLFVGTKRVLLDLRPSGSLLEDSQVEREDPRVQRFTCLG